MKTDTTSVFTANSFPPDFMKVLLILNFVSVLCRSRDVDQHLETWDAGADRIGHTPHAPHLDWSF